MKLTEMVPPSVTYKLGGTWGNFAEDGEVDIAELWETLLQKEPTPLHRWVYTKVHLVANTPRREWPPGDVEDLIPEPRTAPTGGGNSF